MRIESRLLLETTGFHLRAAKLHKKNMESHLRMSKLHFFDKKFADFSADLARVEAKVAGSHLRIIMTLLLQLT